MGKWKPELRRASYRRNAEKRKAEAKAYRQANPEKWKEIHKKSNARLDDVVYAAKAKPCMDCGYSFPACVMQFDHVRGEKVMNIAALRTRGNLQKIIDEIAKCDVVCANCHAIRTCIRDSRPKARRCNCGVAIGGIPQSKALPEAIPAIIIDVPATDVIPEPEPSSSS
jgi:hypothetical protein